MFGSFYYQHICDFLFYIYLSTFVNVSFVLCIFECTLVQCWFVLLVYFGIDMLKGFFQLTGLLYLKFASTFSILVAALSMRHQANLTIPLILKKGYKNAMYFWSCVDVFLPYMLLNTITCYRNHKAAQLVTKIHCTFITWGKVRGRYCVHFLLKSYGWRLKGISPSFLHV